MKGEYKWFGLSIIIKNYLKFEQIKIVRNSLIICIKIPQVTQYYVWHFQYVTIFNLYQNHHLLPQKVLRIQRLARLLIHLPTRKILRLFYAKK